MIDDIQRLAVRGAPIIGVAGAYALVLASRRVVVMEVVEQNRVDVYLRSNWRRDRGRSSAGGSGFVASGTARR